MIILHVNKLFLFHLKKNILSDNIIEVDFISFTNYVRACVTKQHYVSIFFTHLCLVCAQTSAFKVHGYVDWWLTILLLFASFLLAVWFCIYTHAQLKILEISGICVSKSRDLRTDHKRVKNNDTLCCLLGRQLMCVSPNSYKCNELNWTWTNTSSFSC